MAGHTSLGDGDLLRVGRIVGRAGLSRMEMRLVNALLCHPYPLDPWHLMLLVYADERDGGARDRGVIKAMVHNIRTKLARTPVRLVSYRTRGYQIELASAARRRDWLIPGGSDATAVPRPRSRPHPCPGAALGAGG